jgi:hypothetical protein
MARNATKLPQKLDIAYNLSAGVLAAVCPMPLVEEVLRAVGRESQRERVLPAAAVVYYTMAMTLWREVPLEEVFRIICEGVSWLGQTVQPTPSITKAAISLARTRLGADAFEMLADRVLCPIAGPEAPGSWYRGMRLMALDGSLIDLPDSADVADYFGYPGSYRGESAFPQARILSLVEIGTHATVGAEIGLCRTSEQKLSDVLLPKKLQSDMLLLADRNFYGYQLWKKCSEISNLLWRVKSNLILPKERKLHDGSFISRVYDSNNKGNKKPIEVRVIEYNLKKSKDPHVTYRLLTNILDHNAAPAEELAALYHERWEIETSFSEIKKSMKGSSTLIRSRTPELVKQEIWALLITHFAIRQLIAQAAWAREIDPDKLSFLSAVRVVRRKVPHSAASHPSSEETVEGKPDG